MVLDIKDITKDFSKGFFKKRVNVLDGVTFNVNKGEVFGIVGPNGAGKTTTFKCILGFINADTGTIEILGNSNSDYNVKANIGYLPENPYFYEYLTGYELLNYMGSLHGMKGTALNNRINSLLEKVNLSYASNTQLRKYSKGMMQRIAIAQAIVNDPELLILDEPMSGLDPLGRKEITDLILELKREGKTVVLSSHILADLEVLCDRICFIFGGKVVAVGTLYDLLVISDTDYEAVIRKKQNQKVELENSKYRISEDTEGYLSIKFNHRDKKRLMGIILSNDLELISIHPKRESLEHVFEKQFKETSA